MCTMLRTSTGSRSRRTRPSSRTRITGKQSACVGSSSALVRRVCYNIQHHCHEETCALMFPSQAHHRRHMDCSAQPRAVQQRDCSQGNRLRHDRS
jgi:hypothetical protein